MSWVQNALIWVEAKHGPGFLSPRSIRCTAVQIVSPRGGPILATPVFWWIFSGKCHTEMLLSENQYFSEQFTPSQPANKHQAGSLRHLILSTLAMRWLPSPVWLYRFNFVFLGTAGVIMQNAYTLLYSEGAHYVQPPSSAYNRVLMRLSICPPQYGPIKHDSSKWRAATARGKPHGSCIYTCSGKPLWFM